MILWNLFIHQSTIVTSTLADSQTTLSVSTDKIQLEEEMNETTTDSQENEMEEPNRTSQEGEEEEDEKSEETSTSE